MYHISRTYQEGHVSAERISEDMSAGAGSRSAPAEALPGPARAQDRFALRRVTLVSLHRKSSGSLHRTLSYGDHTALGHSGPSADDVADDVDRADQLAIAVPPLTSCSLPLVTAS